MKVQEMKQTLYQKLKDEKTIFEKNDIKIKKQNQNYIIIIKDFEHIPFKLHFENDDYFGYIVYLQYFNGVHYEVLEMFDDNKEQQTQTALLYLGYYIANHF